jgi:hypothetical protein
VKRLFEWFGHEEVGSEGQFVCYSDPSGLGQWGMWNLDDTIPEEWDGSDRGSCACGLLTPGATYNNSELSYPEEEYQCLAAAVPLQVTV